MKNHKIFKKYKDALSYANDLIDRIKGEVLFDDAWDDYLINGENTGDCKLYKNGKFIKTINTNDNYKWSNLIMLYKTDDGFMVYTDFEFDESKKTAKNSIKESLNFKKDYAVSVIGTPSWLKPFYWDFDEFRDDLLIASEEEGFTYYITEATTTDYRINLEYNDGFDRRYDIAFRIIPKSNKATAKELNDYLN